MHNPQWIFSIGDYFFKFNCSAECSRMIDSFVKYLQFEKRVSANTVTAYQTDLEQFRTFLADFSPGVQPEHAEHGSIRSWIITMVESDLDSASVNRKIACLRTYFKFLLRHEAISRDPMAKIKVLKSKKKLPCFVKENDMVSLLDHTSFDDSLEGCRNKLILELFYATGIRLSELININESQLDLRSRTIKVLGKRKKERIVPFPASIVPVIEAYQNIRNQKVGIKDHGLLFVTDSGKRCYPMMVYRIVKKHLEATAADKRSPHVLRHTYATHLLNKGAEINAVKDLLGHSSLAATQVYTHNSMEKIKKAFDQAHPKA